MQQLSSNLWCLPDTCNVYLIRAGDEAILIDFGGGDILDELDAIGVRRVAAVLMTHHHRDQGQGLPRAVEAGIEIWVPHSEQELFTAIDHHWQARELFNNYNMRQDRFSLLEPVPIAGTLRDYGVYSFGGCQFTVSPTPGHTIGSISLLANVDGQLVAFSGDLIAGPGKVWSLAATQWSYNGAEGVAASIPSLLDLKARQPDLLLPSHGEPMAEPTSAVDRLVERLWELLRFRQQNPRLFELIEQPYQQLTPHLLCNRTSLANSYALLSDSHKALLIDYGYDMMTGFASGSDRASRRPWLYTIPTLKRDFDVERIDVVLPTHYHDDHVAGINLLRRVEGTELWAAQNFADILERPGYHDLPCLWYDPIPVDRVLPLGEAFKWEEYELTLYEQPGHTRYAVMIFFEVDSKRVLAIGDQYETSWRTNYVYRGGFERDDYLQVASLYQALAPDLLLHGHAAPHWLAPGEIEMLKERAAALDTLHQELLPLQTANFGTGGASTRIRPYQATVQSGESLSLEVEVRNPFGRAAQVRLQPVLPHGWQTDREAYSIDLPGWASGSVTVTLQPAPAPVRRARIAIDLTINGQPFGQQAEALVTVVSNER